MRAIILAAGKGTRFEGKVKSLLKINEETIIGRLIRQLKSAGIKPIYVVTGFKAEKFLELPDVVLINDPLYHTADNARSLKVALDRIGFEDTVMLDADLVDLRTTDPEAMKLVIKDGYIIKFSKEEGVGSEVCEVVDKERLKKIYDDLDNIRWWGVGPNTTRFRTVEVNPNSKWMDVDTPEEYKGAQKAFKDE